MTDHDQIPKIVCLCGSTRFYEQFQRANYELTMQGNIVLSVGFYAHTSEKAHGEAVGCTDEQKIELDKLHLKKIDLADEIFVINVDGYVGSSTMSEISYAIYRNKPITWLEEPEGGTEDWAFQNRHALGEALANHYRNGTIQPFDEDDEEDDGFDEDYIDSCTIRDAEDDFDTYEEDFERQSSLRGDEDEAHPGDNDITTPEGVKSMLESMLDEANSAGEYLSQIAAQQRALYHFSRRVQEKLAEMDDKVRFQYRQKVAGLADDLVHLLGVSIADLGEMDTIDHRRAIVLQLFLLFSDDDDDDEEEREPEPEPDGERVRA